MSATRNKKYPNHSCVDGNLQGQLCYQCEKLPEPEQPAPEAGEEWRSYGKKVVPAGVGHPRIIAIATDEETAVLIAHDHRLAALVPGLVEALRSLGWHSQNSVDSCWCHVKSDGYAEHTKQCKQIQAVLNAISKERGE